MTIAQLTSDHAESLNALFGRLPASDLTFIKEDVSREGLVDLLDRPGWRWVSLADDVDTADRGGEVDGFAALRPLSGWSDHVAELRLIVDPARRSRGIGRALALHAVGEALHAGLRKVIVEVPAEQDRTIEMFSGIGFTGEALLRDHFRDRDGNLRDLVMLAHFADATFDAMGAVGLADAIGGT